MDARIPGFCAKFDRGRNGRGPGPQNPIKKLKIAVFRGFRGLGPISPICPGVGWPYMSRCGGARQGYLRRTMSQYPHSSNQKAKRTSVYPQYPYGSPNMNHSPQHVKILPSGCFFSPPVGTRVLTLRYPLTPPPS